jgi:hypothetical protein
MLCCPRCSFAWRSPLIELPASTLDVPHVHNVMRVNLWELSCPQCACVLLPCTVCSALNELGRQEHKRALTASSTAGNKVRTVISLTPDSSDCDDSDDVQQLKEKEVNEEEENEEEKDEEETNVRVDALTCRECGMAMLMNECVRRRLDLPALTPLCYDTVRLVQRRVCRSDRRYLVAKMSQCRDLAQAWRQQSAHVAAATTDDHSDAVIHSAESSQQQLPQPADSTEEEDDNDREDYDDGVSSAAMTQLYGRTSLSPRIVVSRKRARNNDVGNDSNGKRQQRVRQSISPPLSTRATIPPTPSETPLHLLRARLSKSASTSASHDDKEEEEHADVRILWAAAAHAQAHVQALRDASVRRNDVAALAAEPAPWTPTQEVTLRALYAARFAGVQVHLCDEGDALLARLSADTFERMRELEALRERMRRTEAALHRGQAASERLAPASIGRAPPQPIALGSPSPSPPAAAFDLLASSLSPPLRQQRVDDRRRRLTAHQVLVNVLRDRLESLALQFAERSAPLADLRAAIAAHMRTLYAEAARIDSAGNVLTLLSTLTQLWRSAFACIVHLLKK